MNSNLQEPLLVKQLAREAGFSEFHFHRIYKSLKGEGPYETLLRLRLEKAIFLLKNYKKMSVGQVAVDSGFSSMENFSRQFKVRYGISPSQFKGDKKLQNSRMYQVDDQYDFYSCIDRDTLRSFNVEIEQLPSIEVALIMAVFGADGSELLQKYHELVAWAERNDIGIQGELTRFGMSIDNPDITPPDKYRYDFALSLKGKAVEPNGLIELKNIPSAKYATVHCKGKLQDVSDAWKYLYSGWLPESGYVPIHFPAIEEFVQGPEEIGWDNFNIKCRIPIEKI